MNVSHLRNAQTPLFNSGKWVGMARNRPLYNVALEIDRGQVSDVGTDSHRRHSG